MDGADVLGVSRSVAERAVNPVGQWADAPFVVEGEQLGRGEDAFCVPSPDAAVGEDAHGQLQPRYMDNARLAERVA